MVSITELSDHKGGANVHVDKLIGKRLGELVPRSDEFLEAMDWDETTYYQARIGRRAFRVSELIAMAKASKQQAWRFLDAGSSGEVTFARAARRPLKPRSRLVKRRSVRQPGGSISAAELLDLFGTEREQKGRTWRALVALNEVVGDLVAINEYIDEAYRELRPLFPDFKQWEGDKK